VTSRLSSFEKWVSRYCWVGRRRRFGISVWERGHSYRLPLREWHEGEGHVRVPFTRWCLATYRRSPAGT
jgi:hypothetical protein